MKRLINKRKLDRILSNLQQRLNDKNENLAIDSITNAAIDLVKIYLAARRFYLGLEPRSPTFWLSTAIRMPNSIIDKVQDLMQNQEKIFKPESLTKEQISNFMFAGRALASVFEEALHEYHDGVCGWINPFFGIRFFLPSLTSIKKGRAKNAIAIYYWHLIQCDLIVYYRELELWNQHSNWVINENEWPSWLAGMCHEVIQLYFNNMTNLLNTNVNIIRDYICTTICLADKFPEGDPAAFQSSTFGIMHNYEESLRKTLIFESNDLETLQNCGTIIEMPWMTKLQIKIQALLHKFFLMQLKVAHSSARRLWIEADAELFAHWHAKGRINSADANKIIELANKAAREEWVLSRLEDGYDGMFEAYEKPTEATSTPIPVILAGVMPDAGKTLYMAMKDRGGRPSKPSNGAHVMTQAEVANAFGEPCNKEMVANWEARARGAKRGANPPDAIYKGERIHYSADLRTNQTPDNTNRLSALISEFQSRHRIKKAIKEKLVHHKTDETLYRMTSKSGNNP